MARRIAAGRRSLRRLRLRWSPPEALLVSYPKAGRTWLRAMIGKSLCDHFGVDDRHMLDLPSLTAQAGLPRIRVTHDGSGMGEGLHYSRLRADKSHFRDTRVVLVSRDVKDTLVSAYFQATRRIHCFEGPIGEFVRDERFGARKILEFYRHWCDAAPSLPHFVHVRYEDLHRDAFEGLRRSLDVLGAGVVTDEEALGAVEFCRFDNLKSVEREKRLEATQLRPSDERDPESFKVRKGKVGNYGEYLSPDEVAFVDGLIERYGCDFTRPPAGPRSSG